MFPYAKDFTYTGKDIRVVLQLADVMEHHGIKFDKNEIIRMFERAKFQHDKQIVALVSTGLLIDLSTAYGSIDSYTFGDTSIELKIEIHETPTAQILRDVMDSDKTPVFFCELAHMDGTHCQFVNLTFHIENE
jgi:hypothetical protein